MPVNINGVTDIEGVQICGVQSLRVMAETFYHRYSLTDGKMSVSDIELFANDLVIKARDVEAALGRLIARGL